MMESLVPALARWGVAPADIHFEAFGPATVRLPGAPPLDADFATAMPMEVKFLRSGRSISWTGKESNLLDFAELHGLVLESGCRAGSCGSCVTPIVSGDVLYDSPPSYDAGPGHCLLCVAKPRSNLVLQA